MLPLPQLLSSAGLWAKRLAVPVCLGASAGVVGTLLCGLPTQTTHIAAVSALAATAACGLSAWQSRSLQSFAAMTEQLQRIALAPKSSLRDLPIVPTSAEATICVGWNVLVRRSRVSDIISTIDARLQHAHKAMESTQPAMALQALSDGVALTDATGSIQWCNPAMAALLGEESEADLQNASLIKRLTYPASKSPDAVTAAATSHQGPFVLEISLGAEFDDGVLRVSRKPLPGSTGDNVQFLWTVRDVTQSALSQNMRNQFVFTATHELRTPLANIRAYAETLSDGEEVDVENQKEFCNVINSEATRLARLIDELLNISQMEAGSLAIEKRETDLLRVFEDVCDSIVAQANHKSIEFKKVLPAKLPKVRVDKDKFEAVLVNLLGNAVKYTPPQGTVTLTVDATPTDLSVHVEDTGFGISEEEIARLFDKFFRSSDERVREVSGNGLGLAFVQEIVRLHGGRINVTSELNRGSKFSVTIPLRD